MNETGFIHQPGKIDVLLFIGVYILPKQSDLLISQLIQFADLSEYTLQRPAALPAPGKWYHTKSAHVIASPHDGYKCSDPVSTCSDRGDIRIGLLQGVQNIHSRSEERRVGRG